MCCEEVRHGREYALGIPFVLRGGWRKGFGSDDFNGSLTDGEGGFACGFFVRDYAADGGEEGGSSSFQCG